MPWINKNLKDKIADRNEIYLREGKSAAWRRLKKVIDALVLKRKDRYLQSQRDVLLVDDARRNYFRNVKAFKTKDRPVPFDARSLFPVGRTGKEVAEELAVFF